MIVAITVCRTQSYQRGGRFADIALIGDLSAKTTNMVYRRWAKRNGPRDHLDNESSVPRYPCRA